MDPDTTMWIELIAFLLFAYGFGSLAYSVWIKWHSYQARRDARHAIAIRKPR